jgi:hypothetical protein
MAEQPPQDDPRWDDYIPEPPDTHTNIRVLPSAQGMKQTPRQRPTFEDPLAGLRILPSIVMRGKDTILAEAQRPIEYVWHEITVLGTVNLIAGPPAEGKTTLLFLLLACRMQDTPTYFLGRNVLPSPPGRYIVLIEAEHSDGGTARKLIQSLETLGFGFEGLDKVLIIARKAVRIGDQAWSEVAFLVSLGLVSDIAVDTLARASAGEANDEGAQAEIFDSIAQTIERAPTASDRPTVWLVAHSRKNDRTGGLGDVSGSTQRTGQSDTVILVEGTKVDGETVSSKVSFPKLREPPDLYPKPVTFSILRDLNGKRRLSSDTLDRLDVGKPIEELIWDQLTEPRTKTDLAERLKRSKEDIAKAVDNLFAAGRLSGAEVSYPGSRRTYKGIQRRLEKASGLSSGPRAFRDASGRQWDDVADQDGSIGND